MNNKKKKIIAIVVPIVLILLIVLAIVLVVVLPKKDNSPAHTDADHTFKYVSKDANYHVAICEGCNYSLTKTHSFKYVNKDATNHTVACDECDYEETKAHTIVFEDFNATNHKVACELCDHNDTKSHTWSNEQASTCSDCGHFRTIVGEVNTPSFVKISSSKTNLKAGDVFTLTVEIESDMPADCIWHSVDLTITPLTEQNKVNTEYASYFECIKFEHNADENYFEISTVGKFDNPDPKYCGMHIGISNVSFDPEHTKADKSFVFTIELKVKEDAPDLSTFSFGVMPTKANYLRYRQDKKNILHSVDGNDVTINTIPLSVKSK